MTDFHTIASIRHQREVDAEAAKEARLDELRNEVFVTADEVADALIGATDEQFKKLCEKLATFASYQGLFMAGVIREICADAINKRAQEWLMMEQDDVKPHRKARGASKRYGLYQASAEGDLAQYKAIEKAWLEYWGIEPAQVSPMAQFDASHEVWIDGGREC